MEIAYVAENVVRLKGKQTTLLTNISQGKSKTPSDGILLLGQNRDKTFSYEDTGIVFQGPGEYEIKGTKITGFKADEEVMFTVHMDGMSVFVGNVSSSLKMKDKLHEHDVVILFADEVLSQAVMGVFNASVFVFVGGMSQENAKAFDKTVAEVGKYVITKDKLPSEAEFVLLG